MLYYKYNKGGFKMTKQEYLDFFNGEIAYRFNSSEDTQSFLNEFVS